MQIRLYNSNAESVRLDKTDYLTNELIINGTLRDECNILNPEIVIETNTNSFRYNYAYISAFNRYYFITDIDVIGEEGSRVLYRISLAVDVLMSYKDEIRKVDVILRRQENKVTPNIVDTKLPCDVNYSINYFYPTDGDNLGSNTNGSYSYIVTVATYVGYNDTERLPSTYHPNNITGNQVYSFSYLMDWKRIAMFSDKLMGGDLNLNDFFNSLFNDVNQCLINVLMLPVRLIQDTNTFGLKLRRGDSKMYIGKGNITLEGELPMIYDSDYIELYLGAITISPVYNNFLDYAPYTELTIFLPFVGYRTLDINECLGKTLHIYYFIDFITGKASCRIYFIKNYDNQVPMYVYDCVVGDSISLSASNVAERIRNLTILGIKTAAGVATMGSTASFVNELPSSTAKQIAVKNRAQKNLMNEQTNLITDTTVNTVQALRNNVEKGDLRSSLSLLDTRNINLDTFQWNVFVRIKRPIPLQKTDYNRLVGRPCIEDGRLNNFEGYTEVASCHMENFPYATQTEVEQIDSILKSGFICSNGVLEWTVTVNVEHGVLGSYDPTIKNGEFDIINVTINEYYTLSESNVTVTNATIVGFGKVSNTRQYQITIGQPTDNVTVQIVGQAAPQTITAGVYKFIDTLPTRATGFEQSIAFTCGTNSYKSMKWAVTGLLKGLFYDSFNVYSGSGDHWNSVDYKTIEVTEDTTVDLTFYLWWIKVTTQGEKVSIGWDLDNCTDASKPTSAIVGNVISTTLTADTGYDFIDVTPNVTNASGISLTTDGLLTFTPTGGNVMVTISARKTPIPVTIAWSLQYCSGNNLPSDSIVGETVTATLIANDGYDFDDVTPTVTNASNVIFNTSGTLSFIPIGGTVVVSVTAHKTVVMTTISAGTYKFLDTVTLPSGTQYDSTFNFKSNQLDYTGMRVTSDTLYYKQSSSETEVYNTTTKWAQEDSAYQVITLENDVTVTDTFAAWFNANASAYTPPQTVAITYNLTNCSSTDKPTSGVVGETTTLTLTADSGYDFDDVTPTVTNASNVTFSTGGTLSFQPTGGAVVVTVSAHKTATIYTLEAGTYKWINSPDVHSADFSYPMLSFTSGSLNFIALMIYDYDIRYIKNFSETGTVVAYQSSNDKWSSTAYQTITLSTAQTVSEEFYIWAIYQGNLVKQATIDAGTYKWVDSPQIYNYPGGSTGQYIDFSSNDVAYTLLSVTNSIIAYINSSSSVTTLAYNGSTNTWTNTAYQTITLSTAQTVSEEFYTWAITGGNLVKQDTSETWYLDSSLKYSNLATSIVNFTSNGIQYTSLERTYIDNKFKTDILLYHSASLGETIVYNDALWADQAYRTITFDEPVTDSTLLLWLQENGTLTKTT